MNFFTTGIKTFAETRLAYFMPFLFQTEKLSDEDIPEKIDEETKAIVKLNLLNKKTKEIINAFFDDFAIKIFDLRNKQCEKDKTLERIDYKDKRPFLIFWGRIQKERLSKQGHAFYQTEAKQWDAAMQAEIQSYLNPLKVYLPPPTMEQVSRAKKERELRVKELLFSEDDPSIIKLEETIIEYVQYCTNRGEEPNTDVTACLSQPVRINAKISYVQFCMSRDEEIKSEVLAEIDRGIPRSQAMTFPQEKSFSSTHEFTFTLYVNNTLEFGKYKGKENLIKQLKEDLQKENPGDAQLVQMLIENYKIACHKQNIEPLLDKLDEEIEALAVEFREESLPQPEPESLITFEVFLEFCKTLVFKPEEKKKIEEVKKEYKECCGDSSPFLKDLILKYLNICEQKNVKPDTADLNLRLGISEEIYPPNNTLESEESETKSLPSAQHQIEAYILQCEINKKDIDMGIINAFLFGDFPNTNS